jgi:hypothetical protein
MPPLSDRKFCESQFYDIEDTEELTVTATAGFMDISAEKQQLLAFSEKRQALRRPFSSSFIKLLFISIVGSCIAVIWILHDCTPASRLRDEGFTSSIFHLVKGAASASTSGVLEVFQVYQPVFTPSGATDETTSDNRSENTTAIAQIAATMSCQVLLMEHSFAYSYGLPFVGQCDSSCSLHLPDILHRKLLST